LSCNFFLQFLVIKALDPDWIRIRIGVQPRMLDPDPDPDEMNADPQPCFAYSFLKVHLHHSSKINSYKEVTK
jgi:hypothetical protein